MDALAAAETARLDVPITAMNTRSGIDSSAANVANARAGVSAAEKQLEAVRARLRENEANDVKAQADLARYRPLAERDIISQQQFDQTIAAAAASTAAVEAAKAQVTVSMQQVEQARGRLQQALAELTSARTGPQQVAVTRSRSDSAYAAVKRYKAALDQAELNLRYTRVIAPVAGVVGKRTVEVGQNVQPGQVLLSHCSARRYLGYGQLQGNPVAKNETGAKGKISCRYLRQKYTGHVDSIAGASGARFSLFPPENATGNYVKVVQRIPVKIVFEKGQDREHLLRPGMSVEPAVKVK